MCSLKKDKVNSGLVVHEHWEQLPCALASAGALCGAVGGFAAPCHNVHHNLYTSTAEQDTIPKTDSRVESAPAVTRNKGSSRRKRWAEHVACLLKALTLKAEPEGKSEVCTHVWCFWKRVSSLFLS